MPARTTSKFRVPPAPVASAGGPQLKELDRVAIGESVDTGAGCLPRGSEGTIVLVWRGGEAFEVEFARPFSAVVTLEPHQLGPVPPRSEGL